MTADKIAEIRARHEEDELCRNSPAMRYSNLYPQSHTDRAYLLAEVERLRADLEIEGMRLVACSIVANANTPKSAAEARQMHSDYRSSCLEDVTRMVDDNIALRAEIERLRYVLRDTAEDLESSDPTPHKLLAGIIRKTLEGAP